jgi:hypothetical protein
MMCGTFGFPRRWIAVASAAVGLHLVAIGMHSLSPAGAAEPEAAKPECLSLAVAVKDVCAWPNLTTLADGSVVATIFNQPCHGLWEGDVECWATADGGQSWKLRGTPAPHEPTTNRMNVAAGRNAKGELVVLASGWSHRPPPPPEGTPATGHGPPSAVLPIWVCRSADGGRTWSRAEGVEPPSRSRLAADGGLTLSDRLIPFGDVIEIGGGKLGVCLYAWHPETKTHASYFFTSGDDGSTWSIAGIIGPDGLNETTPLRLADGNLIACARTYWDGQPGNEQRLELFRSIDNGATWQRERPVSTPHEHPAHLLQLADGRILLTYGDRNGGGKWPDGSPGSAALPHGIEVRLSGDGGRTWSPPERIAGFDGDGGYPATVELADGRLLTAFYAKRSALRDGYQMATVTWRLPSKQ